MSLLLKAISGVKHFKKLQILALNVTSRLLVMLYLEPSCLPNHSCEITNTISRWKSSLLAVSIPANTECAFCHVCLTGKEAEVQWGERTICLSQASEL